MCWMALYLSTPIKLPCINCPVQPCNHQFNHPFASGIRRVDISAQFGVCLYCLVFLFALLSYGAHGTARHRQVFSFQLTSTWKHACSCYTQTSLTRFAKSSCSHKRAATTTGSAASRSWPNWSRVSGAPVARGPVGPGTRRNNARRNHGAVNHAEGTRGAGSVAAWSSACAENRGWTFEPQLQATGCSWGPQAPPNNQTPWFSESVHLLTLRSSLLPPCRTYSTWCFLQSMRSGTRLPECGFILTWGPAATDMSWTQRSSHMQVSGTRGCFNEPFHSVCIWLCSANMCSQETVVKSLNYVSKNFCGLGWRERNPSANLAACFVAAPVNLHDARTPHNHPRSLLLQGSSRHGGFSTCETPEGQKKCILPSWRRSMKILTTRSATLSGSRTSIRS